MLLGLDSYSLRLAFGGREDIRPATPLDLFGLVDRVEELGLDGMQIDPLHLQGVSERTLAVLREQAGERGLFVEAGTMGLSPGELERGVKTSRLLGARVLRTFLGFKRFAKATDIRRELKRARDIICRALDLLGRDEITLAIENHGDVRSGELVGLIEEIGNPRIGICLDVGNSLCVMEDPFQAAERMIPYAVSTHFKDCAITGTDSGCRISGVALGRGVLPLHDLYRLIRDQGTLSRLIIEVPIDAPHGDLRALEREEEAVRESVRFCREALGILRT